MNQYVKIQQIADNLAEHPLLRDIPFDRIVNYTFELIRVIGCPKLYVNRTAPVEIKNYRGSLPCDFAEIIQVRGAKDGKEYLPTMDNFFTSENKPKNFGIGGIVVKQEQKDDECESYIKETTTAYAPTDIVSKHTGSYKIQGNVIFTDAPTTIIEVSYRALEMDEDGYPLLPNNAIFLRAVEAYIKFKRFTILFDMGKINQAVFANAQQEYDWCVGQSYSDFIIPTEDEMQTISNMWNTLIPRVSEHRSGFATANQRQYIKRH